MTSPRGAPFLLLAGAALFSVGCGTSRMDDVEQSVRAFTGVVARDITRDGPVAWQRYFSGDPSFFMAVNGAIAFPDGASAMKAMPGIAQALPHIELHWGNDLRVDPLTENLAVVASSWSEVQVNAAGIRKDERGYFTGVVERRKGEWRFRDAHWSSPVQ